MKHVVTALLLLGVLTAADAQEEDIFAEGAFDAAVSTSQAAAEQSKLTWLGGVSLQSDTTLILPSDREAYGTQSLVGGKAFLKADKPDVGQFFVSYAFSHTLMSSTNDSGFVTGFGQAKPSLDTPKFQLSELHLSFDLGKVVFLRLGNQLVNWGSSFFWSPADFVNQRPADATAAIDTRTGKPGLRVHVPLPVGNVFVFADMSQSLSALGVTQDLGEKGTVGARLDTTVLGWNLGLNGAMGSATNKVQAGGTFSGRLLGFDLWGEYGATLPLHEYAYSWAASVGGERALDDWTLRAEAFWNPDGKPDTELTWAELKNFTPFRWGQQYVFASLTKTKLLTELVDGTVSTIANLTDASYTVTGSLAVKLPKTIPVTLSLRYNNGPENREFTLQNGVNSWTLGLKSVLEF